MKIKLPFLLLVLFIGSACGRKDITPLPFGHFRITLPQRAYSTFDEGFPYSFQYPNYGRVKERANYWSTVELPQFKSDIHLTYKPLDNDLYKYLEESRDLAYNHTGKADGIQEQVYLNPDTKVYGVLYEITGDAASQLQFFVTDSTNHFLRGALYFRATPNFDSIRPVFEYLREDVVHLIETTTWNVEI